MATARFHVKTLAIVMKVSFATQRGLAKSRQLAKLMQHAKGMLAKKVFAIQPAIKRMIVPWGLFVVQTVSVQKIRSKQDAKATASVRVGFVVKTANASKQT